MIFQKERDRKIEMAAFCKNDNEDTMIPTKIVTIAEILARNCLIQKISQEMKDFVILFLQEAFYNRL